MRRDFSVGAYNEILRLISKIESGPGTGITNWYGSGWYEYASWIDSLGIRTHISNVNSYHNTVVARNIAAKNSVDATFNAVGEVDVAYGKVLANINTNLSQWFDYINQLAQIANPKNDRFTSSNMSSSLDGLLKNIEQGKAQCAEDMLVVVVGDELVFNRELIEKYINNRPAGTTEKERLVDLMGALQGAVGNWFPNIGAGERIEIPITPDLTFFYEIEAEIDNDSNIDVVLKDQHAEFNKITIALAENGEDIKIELEVSEDEIGISADHGNVNAGIDFDFSEGVVEGTGSVTVGDNTYTSKLGVGIGKIVVSESIKTEVGDGSVTTEIGLEKKESEGNSNLNLAPVTVPVTVPETVVAPAPTPVPGLVTDAIPVKPPAYSYSPNMVPAWQCSERWTPLNNDTEMIDWEVAKKGGGIIMAGVVVYEVVKWGAAALAAPYSGGTSLVAAAALP